MNNLLKVPREGYKHYTVGFCFNKEYTKVCLVRKCKPEWQKGLLNGVGGFIEEGETPEEGMEREFMEEAGARVKNWKHFLTGDITCHQGNCICYYLVATSPEFIPVRDDKEQVEWYSIYSLGLQKIVPNIGWIIAICMTKRLFPDWKEYALFETI